MDDFIDYLLELLEPLGGVSARKMFGGHGIYKDGRMFGLVADEVLYLKVDAQSKPEFEAEDLGPFIYEKNGKPMAMSYHRVPEAALDEPELMQEWAWKGVDAAMRAPAPKKRKKKA